MKSVKSNSVLFMFSYISILLSINIFFSQCSNSNAALDHIKKTKNLTEINQFIKEHPNGKSSEIAIHLRDSIVFDSVKKVNSKKAYQKFIKNYPNSEFIKDAKNHLKKFEGVRAAISSFRGGNQRNYYGDKIPSRLDILWTLNLGSGKSWAYGKQNVWTGAGWTGQPVVMIEDSIPYLIQGSYDYHLRKINALTGKEVWRYKFDDIIKSTPTIWFNQNDENEKNKIVIMAGSRRGEIMTNDPKLCTSYRQISYFSGKELWRFDISQTPSYSRDCDASCAVLGDTVYQPLENGTFVVMDPDHRHAEKKDGVLQPKILQRIDLWEKADIALHGNNLVNEASPTYLDGKIYIMGGAGRVYAYNLKTKQIDWQFYIGPDLDASAPVTNDSCLLVAFKPKYQSKRGGVFKLDPTKNPKDAVIWYCPVENKPFALWNGGIIGSVAVNDKYAEKDDKLIAAFLAIDGNLYVVEHQSVTDKKEIGPDGKTSYPTPKIVFKKYVGPSISSPIIVGNRLVACTYNGIFLFEFDKNLNFKLIDKKSDISFEASPIAWNNKIYVVSNSTGLLYCFGEKEPKTKK